MGRSHLAGAYITADNAPLLSRTGVDLSLSLSLPRRRIRRSWMENAAAATAVLEIYCLSGCSLVQEPKLNGVE